MQSACLAVAVAEFGLLDVFSCMRSAAFLLALVSSSTVACDCVPSPLEERLRQSDAVFVGEVVAHEPLASVELQVLEVFKGSPGARVLVPTGRSDCDYFVPPVRAAVKERFLVFLTRRKGQTSVSRCLGSKPVAEAAHELSVL
jgi:hypothetical protein